MAKFLHSFAEGLRSKEKMLEDNNDHPAFTKHEDGSLKKEFYELLEQINALNARIEEATLQGKDYDEHLERTLEDDKQKISFAVDAWSKKLK